MGPKGGNFRIRRYGKCHKYVVATDSVTVRVAYVRSCCGMLTCDVNALTFIILTVALSLQVLRKDTESCWVRAEYSNFRSDIGRETFDDAYTNESQTIMALTGRRIKKEQSKVTLVWFSLLLIVNFFFESENLTVYCNEVCL